MIRPRDKKGKYIALDTSSGFDRKKYEKEYYQKNREYVNARQLAWSHKNKEKRKIAKDKWRVKNRERTNFLSRLYHYRKKNAEGTITFEQSKLLYSRFTVCPYCNKNKPNTLDHVIPLTRGGTNNIDNLLPVCVNCNSKKGDKLLVEWRPMLYYMFNSLHSDV